MLYIGLYKLINNKEIFIGDFEMDLAHYMASQEPSLESFELQNLKNPPKNYLPKDLSFFYDFFNYLLITLIKIFLEIFEAWFRSKFN